MLVQLTDAGAALIEANTGPVTVDNFKLGSDYNYVPDPTDVNIRGTQVFTGTPSAPVALNANIVRYSVVLDYSTGPFDFGEVGLFVGSTLFALASSQTLIEKIATAGVLTGNSIRLDIYLSMVGQNYDMWLDIAESNNGFRAAILTSVDLLPSPQNATPNMYIVSGESVYQSAFLAYTDRTGRWNFDAYEYADAAAITITGFDNQSVNIALSDYNTQMHPDYLGKIVLEFGSGALFGVCRYVSSAVISGNTVTLGFDNPLMTEPIVGDQVVVFIRQSSTTTIPNIPPATTSVIGGVIVGQSLTVDETGLLNVDYTKVPFPVTSVNGKTGAVILAAGDISGFATVATSGNYNDLTNKPAAYSLPVATTSVLGGVKAPSNGSITIAGDGTLGLGSSLVTSVAGRSGAVVLTYADIGGLATVAHSGDYNDLINKPAAYTLPVATSSVLGGVKQGTNVTIAADGTISAGAYTLPVATTVTLGGVKQGANVTIAADGTISVAAAYSLPIATASVLGGVKQGTGVTIAGDGTLSATAYTLPVATASVLGGVKQGANVTIAGDGTLSVAAAPVTSVNGLTGAVTVYASDANTATGTSLITNNGQTTGNITLKRIVGGTGITLSLDASSNLLITNSQTAYTLPVATTSVLGGVKQGTGVSIAGDGTLSATGVTSVSTLTGAVVVQASDHSTASGTSLIYDGGTTTANIKLLRLVNGTNISIAADGNGNLVINNTQAAAPVTSVSTLTGAVVIQASDANTASGTSLISNTGSTTGNIKLLRLVAGSNVTITPDANGNLAIAATQAAAPVTSVSGQTGAVTIQASDLSTASGTSLISNSGSTTGNIKLLRLVAGTNISLTTDGNGNLVVTNTAGTGVTTFNTRSGVVTLTNTDISNAGGALLTDVAASKYYDLQGGAANALTASQILMQHVAVRALTIPASFAGSKAYAASAATAAVTLTVSVLTIGGSTTTVGTIAFAAGGSVPQTWTSTGFSVAAGQVVIITGPSSADATFGNVSLTLLGLAT
jgi:hypothetical protein